MIKISVVICSHNPRPGYLSRTLQGLRVQNLPKFEWELLLIDNASKEPLAHQWDLSWHPQSFHVREETLGLTPARLRGIKDSRGEILLFVDDDNILASDYLERALLIASAFPHISVFGAGALEPEFEVQPPPELCPLTHMLALRTVPKTVWSNNSKDTTCIPWGAGLCVRRVVAQRYLELVARLATSGVLDRRGGQLFCGGDDLFSWVAAGKGEGFGVFTELRIVHLINSNRLSQDYFLRLLRDHAFSHTVLRYLLFAEKDNRKTVGSVIRTVLHGIRRGRFAMRCRWASLVGAGRATQFIEERKLRSLATEFFPHLSPSVTAQAANNARKVN